MSEWINTKDRLPELNVKVLVYLGPFKEISFAWRDNCQTTEYYDRWITIGDYMYPDELVTHWMNLPEKPEQ
jgi:hypothetical protein